MCKAITLTQQEQNISLEIFKVIDRHVFLHESSLKVKVRGIAEEAIYKAWLTSQANVQM